MFGDADDGYYEIWPNGKDGDPVTVFCDLTLAADYYKCEGCSNFWRFAFRAPAARIRGRFWLGLSLATRAALTLTLDDIRCVKHLPATFTLPHVCAASLLAGSCLH